MGVFPAASAAFLPATWQQLMVDEVCRCGACVRTCSCIYVQFVKCLCVCRCRVVCVQVLSICMYVCVCVWQVECVCRC